MLDWCSGAIFVVDWCSGAIFVMGHIYKMCYATEFTTRTNVNCGSNRRGGFETVIYKCEATFYLFTNVSTCTYTNVGLHLHM